VGRILIRCGHVVSMDAGVGVRGASEILIENDRIRAIGADLQASADETIEAGEMIALPGLINMHMHTFQAGLRAVGSNWLGPDYFRHLYGDMSIRYTPEDNYLGTLLGALNQLNSGVTTLFDYSHNLHNATQAERSVDALEESGLRAVLGLGRGKAPGTEPHPPEQRRHDPAVVAQLRRRLASDDARVTLALAASGPHWGTFEVSLAHVRLAREFGLMISTHVTRPHAKAIVPDGYDRMAAMGLLGPDHNLVHCQHLARDELKRLMDTGASVTSTCMNELHDYGVYPAAGRVHDMGGLPSLGIDVEAMVPGDMWREMQTALLFARNEALRDLAARDQQPARIPVRSRDALAWATTGGARALRRESQIGVLAPGAKADLILLRAGDLNMWPVHDPVLAAVEQAHAGNVDTVLVDGVVRKRGGKLTYDATTLRRKQEQLAASAQRLMDEAQFRLERG
jgi:cytosine/adenosine deaminase-related metal-dependent hydrolase